MLIPRPASPEECRPLVERLMQEAVPDPRMLDEDRAVYEDVRAGMEDLVENSGVFILEESGKKAASRERYLVLVSQSDRPAHYVDLFLWKADGSLVRTRERLAFLRWRKRVGPVVTVSTRRACVLKWRAYRPEP